MCVDGYGRCRRRDAAELIFRCEDAKQIPFAGMLRVRSCETVTTVDVSTLL